MNWSIVANVILVILLILVVVLAVLYFLGRKMEKRQVEQQSAIDAAESPNTAIVSGSPNRTKLLRKIAWMITPLLGFSFTIFGMITIRSASTIRILAPVKIKSNGLGSDSASAL